MYLPAKLRIFAHTHKVFHLHVTIDGLTQILNPVHVLSVEVPVTDSKYVNLSKQISKIETHQPTATLELHSITDTITHRIYIYKITVLVIYFGYMTMAHLLPRPQAENMFVIWSEGKPVTVIQNKKGGVTITPKSTDPVNHNTSPTHSGGLSYFTNSKTTPSPKASSQSGFSFFSSKKSPTSPPTGSLFSASKSAQSSSTSANKPR